MMETRATKWAEVARQAVAMLDHETAGKLREIAAVLESIEPRQSLDGYSWAEYADFFLGPLMHNRALVSRASRVRCRRSLLKLGELADCLVWREQLAEQVAEYQTTEGGA